jgi:PAS domain S-box-containing protein
VIGGLVRVVHKFKVLIACAGCIALIGALAGVSVTTSHRLVDTVRFVSRADETISQLDSIENNLLRAEAAFGDRKDLGDPDYQQALSQVRISLEKLKGVPQENGAERQIIEHLRLLVERRIASPGDAQLKNDVQRVIRQVASDRHRDLEGKTQSVLARSQYYRLFTAVSAVAAFAFVILCGIAVRRDLLRREKSESALQITEQNFRRFFENAPLGIFESSEDGRWLTANPMMAAMLGYDSIEELLDHRNKLRTPLYVDPNARAALIDRIKASGVVQDCETQWFRKDGRTIWVTGSGRLVEDRNGKRRFEAMLHDISERKFAEEQLANVKSQLENLLNSATGVSIISTDIQGKITIFNPGAENMLGYSAHDMVGRTFDRFHFEPEVLDRSRALATKLGHRISRFEVFIENVKNGGHETREWTYVCKNGRHLAVALTMTGIRNPRGELIGFLGIAVDITDRRRGEQERAALERQLRRQNIELERETRRAREANRMKSEFLANMSHELRTPLNAIIGFAEIMHDEVTGSTSEEHKEYLNDILTSGRHLLQLINDILDLSKVEAGKMEFEPEEVDLARMIREVQAILNSLSTKKHLLIETDLDPQIGRVSLDPRRLKQVLYNYLSNAIKFTPERGTICIRTRRESEMFRIEVEDTGIGVRKEDLDQLFVEFQQLDESATKRYEGTGLGLALTKRIVEMQGGKVGVVSTSGRGSVFFAVLPIEGSRIATSELVENLPYTEAL